MTQIFYSVICKIDFPSMEQEWLDWLRGGHIDEVISCGASSAEVVKHDKNNPKEPGTTYEIRYKFESREAYESYIDNHAMRLREEGLEKFPVSDGFHYQRVSGDILD